ncbi:MAG: 30S ribosomal protein S20 [Alphaproteobacteria bacterium]
MANIASAKKRIRTTARRTEINTNRRSRMRSYVRKAEEAIASGDKDLAVSAFRTAESEIAKAHKAGILHKNTAARKTSRLAARVKAIA